MSEVRPTFDDEIDLFELFKTLWDGKWKIIATTSLAAAIGVVFSAFKPNSFIVSTPIQAANPSVFLPYTALNNLLKKNGLYFDKESNAGGFKFDTETVFENFVAEFNDYDEMLEVISEVEIVKQSIKDLDDIDKKRALIDFYKKIKIIKNKNNWVLQFDWHDDYEGRRLFSNAIKKTLFTIHNKTKKNFLDLVRTVEIQNSLELEKLKNYSTNAVLQIEKEKLKKRVKFLDEQSAIATELGIDSSKLSAFAFSQTSSNTEVPYYLRGYKAINKEIALIKSRSDKEIMLMADDVVLYNEKIAFLQNDISSSQLKNVAKAIDSINPENWVNFDMELADAKSQKKSMLYVALSMVLGGMVGVIYVLISNSIRKSKGQLAKA